MAMTQCRECGHEISTKAKSCPHCGATIYRPSGCFVVILLFIAFAAIMSAFNQNDSASPPKTQEQIQAEARRELAFQKVVLALKAIKTSLRNPDSVVWEYIGANEDASAICIGYRAQNGFGGMSREYMAIVNGTPTKQFSAWNKHCVNNKLNDMMYARRALDD
jgi:hypothetical protein